MAEILTKESETGELEIFTSGAPTTLSADQIENFTKIIRDNSPYLQDQIKELKTRYPEVLGDVSPITDSEISELSEIDASKLASRLNNYQKIALEDVTSISSTTGFTVIAADPNSARFAERTDTALKNFFKVASKTENFNLDMSTELQKLTKMVGNFSKTFIGKISDSLGQGLVSFMDTSMMNQANLIFKQYQLAQLPRSLALKAVKAFQSSLIGPTNKLFDGLGCLTEKVVGAMSGVISDMLTSMTKNMLNAPTCATQQFIGALTNKIADAMDNLIGPLLGPIQKILSPIGAIFNVKDKIMGGIDFMSKVGGLFKCELPEKQTSSFKYTIDGLLKKDLGGEEHKSLLDGAMNAAATTNSFLDKAASGLSNFEKSYVTFLIPVILSNE